MQKRKRACVACGEDDELRRGFCKRCFAARCCHVCKDINCDGDALLCISCQKKHNDIEVKSFKLALWCRTCNSAEELSRGLCWNCSRHTCDQCGTSTGVLPTEFSCSETSCRAKLHYCDSCIVVTYGVDEIQCVECWSKAGHVCVRCNRNRVRADHHRPFWVRTC